jgi:hypothetical protein
VVSLFGLASVEAAQAEAGGWLTPAVATLMAAVVALTGVGATVFQKWRSDRRDAWWKRAQWAIDKSLNAEPDVREIGNRAMLVLVNEKGVSDTDLEVLRAALVRAAVDVR